MGARLGTVIVFTPDMESLGAWYRDVLELGEWERSEGHIGQRVGEVWFGLDEDRGAVSGGGTVAWFHVDDLQRTFDRAVATGAEVIYPPTKKPYGYVLASVRDPDGNRVGLAQTRSG